MILGKLGVLRSAGIHEFAVTSVMPRPSFRLRLVGRPVVGLGSRVPAPAVEGVVEARVFPERIGAHSATSAWLRRVAPSTKLGSALKSASVRRSTRIGHAGVTIRRASLSGAIEYMADTMRPWWKTGRDSWACRLAGRSLPHEGEYNQGRSLCQSVKSPGTLSPPQKVRGALIMLKNIGIEGITFRIQP